MNISIHINNSLHGKLYFLDLTPYKKLLLSSANFTRNGLSNNSEWGMLISDEDVIQQAKDEVFADLDLEGITETQVKNACMHAEHYADINPNWTAKPEVEADILGVLTSAEDNANHNPKYFLKPIGHTDSPIWKDDRQDFSQQFQKQNFSSSKKPVAIAKGDYIITTAIGSCSLLSYFRATGRPEFATAEEIEKAPWLKRWGWYIESKNYSRDFGSRWWEFDLERNRLANEFNELYPQIPVTKAGGFNLKSINYGSDKLELSPEFGRFLIDKIDVAVK
nr:phospholipase D-like domain-containing protein [Oleiphilus sp. HI0128]